jgi:3-oxoacyl-[acyl-carrier protein] reductase
LGGHGGAIFILNVSLIATEDVVSGAGGRYSMNDPLDFTNKIVLVVGGSSGIGNGIAQNFRAAGAEVHVWGTRAAAASYAKPEGSDMEGLYYSKIDVSDFDAVANHSLSFDRLDVLVLSQGSVLYRRAEFEMDGFRRIVDINLNSLMACATKFKPMLVRAQGALIIVSSNGAYTAMKGTPAYAASKAGAVSLCRTLGQAWAPEGIRVNGIAPGLVDTKLTKVTTEYPDRLESILERIPMRRLGTPQDMGQAALFLASSMAGYICGQTLLVDGGMIL